MAAHIDTGSWDPRHAKDPYSFFARMRERPPVQVVLEGMSAWLITRYDDVRAGLSDPRLSSDPALGDDAARAVPWLGASQASTHHMGRLDPPDHTRLRGLVAKAFTPRRIAALRPQIQQITDDLVAAFRPRGHADVVAELAQPLPLTVISELFGVPPVERKEFGAWTGVFFGFNEGDAARREDARRWISAYLTQLIERRGTERAAAADPEDGTLLDGLIAAHHHGDRISDDELLAMSFLLLVAGYDTTVNLIASGVLSLLLHPEQLAALRADPALIRPAIEEFLRYESPVKITPFVRFTTTEVTLGGVVIPARQAVLLALAAGNRDPAHFRDPDRLDLSRGEPAHLSFGHGIHFCLGAPLARLEAEIALTALLAACPDLALAIEPQAIEWRHSWIMRGVMRLPVTFRAAQ